jgi:DNA mismatch endonuclease (patch repair protein)
VLKLPSPENFNFVIIQIDVDRLTPSQRSFLMSRIRSKNTRPEMIVRRLVHKIGCRYRLHSRDLPGKPDLVFASRRKVIFVNGCFWHYHRNCHIAGMPSSNKEYWAGKLERTRARDKSNLAKLKRLGWKVKTIWECDLADLDALSSVIIRFLET